MKVIYVAGPFRGSNAWIVEQNIRRAEALAFVVAELGHAALCPHANTRFFNGTLTDQYWLDATLEMLRRCDAVLLTDDYQRSTGAMGEVAEAFRLGIPVFTDVDSLAEWLRGAP